jgi:hypothetical protein
VAKKLVNVAFAVGVVESSFHLQRGKKLTEKALEANMYHNELFI